MYAYCNNTTYLFLSYGLNQRLALGVKKVIPNAESSTARHWIGNNMAKWRPSQKLDSCRRDPILRDLQVALAGLLQGSPGWKFLAQVLRVFRFFGCFGVPILVPFLVPKMGPQIWLSIENVL